MEIGKKKDSFSLNFYYYYFFLKFSIGVTKEQARVLDMNGDQFVCPPCQSMIVGKTFLN
jgi:hypothetical protein